MTFNPILEIKICIVLLMIKMLEVDSSSLGLLTAIQ